MRLLNDNKNEQEQKKPLEVGISSVILFALFYAFGIVTVVFAPLPIILAHLRLKQPWPKASAVLGAILALTLFKVPLLPVLMTFIFSLYIADSIDGKKPFWSLLGKGLVVAILIAGASIFVLSQMNQMGVWEYWTQLIEKIISQFSEAVQVEKDFDWEAIKAMLLYEGPFLLLSAAIMSIWISVGAAAHLGWFDQGHSLSAKNLRDLKLPPWVSLVFIGFFVAEIFGALEGAGFLGGVFRVVGSLMFIQGCVCLSGILLIRGLNPRMRTLVYSLAIFLGFYVVVGMGVICPWLLRWQERYRARQPRD